MIDRHTPELVLLGLLAALVVAGLAFGGSDDANDAESSVDEVVRKVPQVARRVEGLRALRFERRPRPRVVGAAAARRAGIADLDRRYPARKRLADEEVLKLLGLLEPDVDLRRVEASVFEGQVAGYYDTRRNTLALVRESAGSDPGTAEITLAHELTHALEDDALGIDEPPGAFADEAIAYAALVEGSATKVMIDYAERHLGPGTLLGAALASFESAPGVEDLPAYVRESLEFPYLGGNDFVESLHETAGGWKLVDHALENRPPRSSEQVLHPAKYLADERPRRPRLPPVRDLLGTGWQRTNANSFGEFDTVQLLKTGGLGDREADSAAAGWGGGRFELWTRGPLPAKGCPAPCRERDALVLAWRWDTPADAREFARALERFSAEVDGEAAARASGNVVTLALAPTAELARRLTGPRASTP